jgi:hypothetical protein
MAHYTVCISTDNPRYVTDAGFMAASLTVDDVSRSQFTETVFKRSKFDRKKSRTLLFREEHGLPPIQLQGHKIIPLPPKFISL